MDKVRHVGGASFGTTAARDTSSSVKTDGADALGGWMGGSCGTNAIHSADGVDEAQ